LFLSLLTGFVIILIYQYNSLLWTEVVRICHILQNHDRMKRFILSFGAYSPLAYILLQVIQVVVAPIPGGAIEFLGGYLFGVKAGLIYSMIGLVIASWLAFGLARIFEKWAVEKFVSPQTLKKFDYLIGHEGVILSFLLSLTPRFSKGRPLLHLGSDTHALRDFSNYLNDRKGTRDIDGDPSGSESLRSSVQILSDPLGSVRSYHSGLLYLP